MEEAAGVVEEDGEEAGEAAATEEDGEEAAATEEDGEEDGGATEGEEATAISMAQYQEVSWHSFSNFPYCNPYNHSNSTKLLMWGLNL